MSGGRLKAFKRWNWREFPVGRKACVVIIVLSLILWITFWFLYLSGFFPYYELQSYKTTFIS
jgi:hypothetical protein